MFPFDDVIISYHYICDKQPSQAYALRLCLHHISIHMKINAWATPLAWSMSSHTNQTVSNWENICQDVFCSKFIQDLKLHKIS